MAEREILSPAWVWFAGAMLILFVQALGASMGGQIALMTQVNSFEAAAVQGAGMQIAGLIAGVMFVLMLGQTTERAGMSLRRGGGTGKAGVQGLGVMLIIAPFLFVVPMGASWVSQLVTGIAPDPIAHETLARIVDEPGSWAGLMMIMTALIGAPIVEEIIFRGCVQTSLRALGASPWIATLITAGFFTAMHITAVPVHALVSIFVLAIALGWAFERSGKLGVSIGMHVGFNGLNLMLAIFGGY